MEPMRRAGRSRIARLRRPALAALCAALALGAAASAQADRVETKGAALEGRVKSLSGDELVLETVYGEGELTIPVEEIDALETDDPFYLVHGEDVRTVGRVTGVEDGVLLVEGRAGEVAVPLASLHSAVRDPGPEASALRRMEVALPYWSGSFRLAFAATQGTDDSLSFSTGLDLERERGPHRTRIRSHYRLGTQQPQGEDEETTANELYGKLRQEYSFAERWFAYGSVDAEYDEVEDLSLRTVPSAGVGYDLFRSEEAWITVDAGGAWVYERFFGGEENTYPGLALGAESEWELPFGGAVWRNRIGYTPSFEDFFGDYLLRAETTLEMPLWSRLSFTASVIDTYDSTPSEGNDRNELSTLVGLAYGF